MNPALDSSAKKLDLLTKISANDRQKSLRWLSRQNDLVIYDVFKLQKNHFHRLRSQNAEDDLTLLSMTSLFLALKESILSSQAPNRKCRSSDFGFLRQVSKNRAKQFRKPRQKAKYEKLMNLQSVVLTLIDQNNYSYREAARYLMKYHKFEVSHMTIGQFYKTLTKEAK